MNFMKTNNSGTRTFTGSCSSDGTKYQRKADLVPNEAPGTHAECAMDNKKPCDLKMICVNFTGGTHMFRSTQWVPKNRVVTHEPERFIHISFSNLEFDCDEDKQKYSERVKEILTDGVEIEGIKYHFCGFSRTQLHNQSCFMYAAESVNEVTAMLNSFWNFSNDDSVENRIKAMGHLLSETKFAVEVDAQDVAIIPDILGHERQNFTDSCGLIDLDFARLIAKRFSETLSTPSVFRFCHEGRNGLLVVKKFQDQDFRDRIVPIVQVADIPEDIGVIERFVNAFKKLIRSDATAIRVSSDDKNQHTNTHHNPKIIFRSSMEKFVNLPKLSPNLFIVDKSEPGQCGHLNAQYIAILSTLGIPDDVFLQRQTYNFHLANNALSSPKNAQDFAEFKGRYDLVNKLEKNLLSNASSLAKISLYNLRKEELLHTLDPDIQKVQIPIFESRNLLGVSDFSGKLRVSQCMVNVRMGSKIERITGRVIVGRSPCLYPGDIQLLHAVRSISVPELAHLVDCIVFSTEGSTPPSTCVNGGHLDGGKFWVCWDKDLTNIQRGVPPLNYSNLPPLCRQVQIENTQLKLIEYFSNYTSNQRQIMSLYWEWIRVNPMDRAFSLECAQLNELYTRSRRGEHITIPESLKSPPTNCNYYNPFILDLLKSNISNLAKKSNGFRSLRTVSPTDPGVQNQWLWNQWNGPSDADLNNGYRILPIGQITNMYCPRTSNPRGHHIHPTTSFSTSVTSYNNFQGAQIQPRFRPRNQNNFIRQASPRLHIKPRLRMPSRCVEQEHNTSFGNR